MSFVTASFDDIPMRSQPNDIHPVTAIASHGAKSLVFGTLAALLTVAMWAGGIVVTRLGVTTTLTPYDVGFLRCAVPAVLLAPVLARKGLALRQVGAVRTIAMVGGSGIPFFLVSSAGMQFAPAGHVGALMPGTMPIFVALLSALFFGEEFDRWRRLGFAFILAGALWVGGYSLILDAGGEWRGHALFITAAFMWACYTVAFRSAGIGAWHATALISFYSAVGFLPVYVWIIVSRFPVVPWSHVALQIGYQGIVSGLLATFMYGQAIRLLGASRAAVFGCLTPVMTALGGLLILGEALAPATLIGIGLVSVGVAFATGVAGRWVRCGRAPQRTPS